MSSCHTTAVCLCQGGKPHSSAGHLSKSSHLDKPQLPLCVEVTTDKGLAVSWAQCALFPLPMSKKSRVCCRSLTTYWWWLWASHSQRLSLFSSWLGIIIAASLDCRKVDMSRGVWKRCVNSRALCISQLFASFQVFVRGRSHPHTQFQEKHKRCGPCGFIDCDSQRPLLLGIQILWSEELCFLLTTP